jgi:bifunctional pyridoxal-dependent enzyme with beta-cystathionase and maltose regulon repressor activities
MILQEIEQAAKIYDMLSSIKSNEIAYKRGAEWMQSKLKSLIEAQEDYILYLREAIDRVYPHIKPSKYYDAEFLLRGDLIRKRIEEEQK